MAWQKRLYCAVSVALRQRPVSSFSHQGRRSALSSCMSRKHSMSTASMASSVTSRDCSLMYSCHSNSLSLICRRMR